MHMGMGTHLVMQQSLALEMRQCLEMRLEQALIMKQELRMALLLYQKREEICTRLYREALKQGRVRQYSGHEMTFEFALVSVKDVPKDIYTRTGHAFAHCLMKGWDVLLGGERYARAQGSWLLFVIDDMYGGLPPHAINYAAVHEYGEMVTLGQHNLASKLEFAIAAKERQLRQYMVWIESTCPAKFADVFSYQVHTVLPESEELQCVLETFQSSENAQRIRAMMEGFAWPYSVLQRLRRYQKKNEEAIKILTPALEVARFTASDVRLPATEIIAKIRGAIEEGLRTIVAEGLVRYMSPVRIRDLWRELRVAVDREYVEMLTRKRAVLPQEDYLREVVESGCHTIPLKGMMSLDFDEVLQHLPSVDSNE